jgi:beta-glucosidase
MKWLGLRAYRFSLAWPRIFPDGRGRVNESGMAFYEKLVDALLEAGIEPYVTLYHWDLPQVLEDGADGPARSEVARIERGFEDAILWRRARDLTMTVRADIRDGVQAPGRKMPGGSLAAAHHLLLSHGWAMHAIRSNVRGARAGITLNLVPAEPASGSAADADACRASDGQANRWFLDPLYGHGYPADVIEDRWRDGSLACRELPFVERGDLNAISLPTDFLGINYYARHIARSSQLAEKDNDPPTVQRSDELTAMGWEVWPDGLERILRQVHARYAPAAIYVTENGAAYDDPGPNGAGPVADTARTSCISATCAPPAARGGVPLKGYFLWSLADNWWSFGRTKRFGILWVDYATQERSPRERTLTATSSPRRRREHLDNGPSRYFSR